MSALDTVYAQAKRQQFGGAAGFGNDSSPGGRAGDEKSASKSVFAKAGKRMVSEQGTVGSFQKRGNTYPSVQEIETFQN